MTLAEIGEELKKIGIEEFRDFDSEISDNPKHIKLEFKIDFEADVFGEDCDRFWEFFSQNTKGKSIDVLAWEISPITNLLFEYEDGDLRVINENRISDTEFFEVLENGLKKFFEEIDFWG